MNTDPQTFQNHLHELRRRILWVVLAASISGILGYIFRNPIIAVLQKPLNAPLFYSSPAGSFNFILKVSTIIGVFIALPVIVYQLLRFIEPALPRRIKGSTIFKLILASFVLASIGAAFGFFIMVPTSLKFFASYSNAQIKPLISADSYLNFVLNTLITFALVFQIPLFVMFYDHIKPTKPRQLLRYQKHVVVGSFVLAVLLPFTYDPVSQFVMAVPIIFLFYLSAGLLWWTNHRRRRTAKHAKPVPHIIAEPAPIPAPVHAAVPQLQPAARTIVRSMDGFVISERVRPTQFKLPAAPVLAKHADQHQPPKPRLFGRPTLAIDGVSPRPHTA